MSYILYKLAEFTGAIMCGSLFIMLILVMLIAVVTIIIQATKFVMELFKN